MKIKPLPNIVRTVFCLGISLVLGASANAALVGYWNFDNTTNPLAETSGFRPAGTHDGIVVGNVGYTTGVGGTGYALDMRYNQGAVKIKNTDENANPEGHYTNTFNELLYSSPTGFSIAFWAKDLPTDAWQPWISRNGDSSWGYQVRRTDQNFATFTLRGAAGTGDPTPSGASTDFTDGRWHHIAAVYDPVNHKRNVYVDGNLEISIADGTSALSNNSGEYLVFGALNINANVTNVFQNYSHCAIDDVRIYNNALSQANVTALVSNLWIYADTRTATMTNGGSDIVVPVTVPTSLVATSAVEVAITSPNTAIVDLVGGTAGVLKLEFPKAGGITNLSYTLHATGQGIVTMLSSCTNKGPTRWVDGSKQVIVWPSTQPTNGLVAYWNFRSNSLAESGGYAPTGLHDGTAIGNISYTTGPLGNDTALVISNANTAVRINNSGVEDRDGAQTFGGDLYNSPNGFSIAFWAKNLPAGSWNAWISKYGDSGYGYQVRKYSNTGSANFTLRGSINGGDTSGTLTSFSDGNWHHVVAVYDPVNFLRLLYVDGVAQISIIDGDLSPSTIPGQHVLFGGEETDQNQTDQGINYGNDVCLAEVRFYKTALANTDVMNLFDSVSVWPLSLNVVSPSPNTNTITISVPPSLVATSSVSVLVTSDDTAAAIPVGAVGGVLTVTFPMGGTNTATINVQANGPGTAHFTYSSPQIPQLLTPMITTVAVQQPNIYGLVAYWNFDSQTLAETSGFQPAGTHDGVAIGNVAYVPGRTGGYALDLRQPNTEVRIQNSTLTDANYRNTFDGFLYGSSQGFTISCWVKGLPQSDWTAWIAKDGEANGYQIRKYNTGPYATFTLRNSTGSDDYNSTAAVITDNLWHHLAAVYDPVAGQRTLYIDGVAQLTEADSGLTTPPSSMPLYFGGRDVLGGNPFIANVILDEVRVYDTALTASQIVAQVGASMITVTPGTINLSPGDPDTAMISIAVPSSLVATSSVSVTLTTGNAAVAEPVGATGSSLVVNFPMGGTNMAFVAVHAVAVGSTDITATSPQAVVNGDVTVNVVAPAPQLIGHWFSGAASLAETSGYRPAGTHDGVAVGGSPGNLAYNSDVPAGFSGQSLDLTAGGVAVSVMNSASGDAGYLPTYDGIMSTNFTIAFWAKGLPNSWSAWMSKDGDEGVGYQIRQYGGNNDASFTIRGTLGDDDIEGFDNLSDTTVWHQYTAVWNGVMGTRQLYIDGQLDPGINEVGDFGPFALASNVHMVFGGQEQSGGLNPGFAGLLYDIRVYNGALSTVGIQSLQVPPVVITPPVLTVQPWTGNQVRIFWPVAATGFTLQESTNLLGSWTSSSLSVGVEGTNNAAYAPTTNSVEFYRLMQ